MLEMVCFGMTNVTASESVAVAVVVVAAVHGMICTITITITAVAVGSAAAAGGGGGGGGRGLLLSTKMRSGIWRIPEFLQMCRGIILPVADIIIITIISSVRTLTVTVCFEFVCVAFPEWIQERWNCREEQEDTAKAMNKNTLEPRKHKQTKRKKKKKGKRTILLSTATVTIHGVVAELRIVLTIRFRAHEQCEIRHEQKFHFEGIDLCTWNTTDFRVVTVVEVLIIEEFRC